MLSASPRTPARAARSSPSRTPAAASPSMIVARSARSSLRSVDCPPAADTHANSMPMTQPGRDRLKRCKAPHSIVINLKSDLEGFDDAPVRTQHLANGYRTPNLEEAKCRQDGVDIGQITAEVIEYALVCRSSA